jgi:hypothetical protein
LPHEERIARPRFGNPASGVALEGGDARQDTPELLDHAQDVVLSDHALIPSISAMASVAAKVKHDQTNDGRFSKQPVWS